MEERINSQELKQSLVRLEEKPKVEEKKPKSVSILSLFRFATQLDVFLMIGGSLAALGAGAVFPFFMIFFGQIILVFRQDARDQAESEGLKVAIRFFALGVVSWILNFFGLYFWNLTGARQTYQYKKTYYRTLLDQEVAWYDSVDTNQTATQVSGNIVAIETAIGEKMCMIQSVTVTSVFGFIYAFFKCWELALVLTGVLPLLIGAGYFMMKTMMLNATRNKVSYEKAGGIAEQAIAGIRTIKSLVGEYFQENKFVKTLEKSYGMSMKYTFLSSIAIGVIILVFLGIYALGFWFGKVLIMDTSKDYDASAIISTFFCFIVGGSSVGQISPMMKNIADAKVAASRLFQLMEREKSLEEPKKGKKIDIIKQIEFENVTFKYPKLKASETDEEAVEVLKKVSISFKKNKVTALVGQSGSGKSTVVQLLMRYYDPTSGTVKINGKELSKVNLNKYRRQIGFVGQEPVLFSMSVEENIRLANPKLTDQELKEALKKANAYNFIMKMNDGLNTYVGTGGTQLSGGQKQRVAIARAICRNPSVLILDEATSALDRKNEKEIQQTLKSLSEGNITSIVIAHRLSTIRNADEIIVMGKGQVLERGTHQELIAKEGEYYKLVKTQISAEEQEENDSEPRMMEEMQIQGNDKSEDTTDQLIDNLKIIEKKQEEVPPVEQQKAVFRKILYQTKDSYGLYIAGGIAALIRGMIFPFFNVALSNVLALLAQARDPEKAAQLDIYCLAFMGIAIVGGISTFSYMFSFGVIGQRLVFKLRKLLFRKLLHMPIEYYDKPTNTPGGIASRLAQDAFQIHNMTTGVFGVVFLNFATVTTSLIIAFYYSWLLTIIVIGLSPIMVASNAVEMAAIKRFASKNQDTEKYVGSMISDTINNIRTVKSFGNNEIFFKKYEGKLTDILETNKKKVLRTAIFQALSKGNIMIVEGIMFFVAAILFQNSLIIDPTAVYVAIFSIIFAAAGIGNNSAYMPDMAKAKIAGANVFSILESEGEDEISKKEGGLQKESVDGVIEFKGVTFKYPQRDQLILDNFNLTIKRGEKIGLVGPSGSGKSTLIQLLLRFYPVTEGQITINGRNINEYDLYHYRQQLGLVSQEPTLFQGTVRDNIEYQVPRTDKEIEKYTNICHATEFIKGWEQGLNKQVGQKGTQISGGQKQRIAMIRCLIRDPTFFLLDQSTSALDADTEKIVFENLKPIFKGHTSISIAHRLSTIQDANRIIMMRNGKIIETGSFQELMEMKDNFYRLAKGYE